VTHPQETPLRTLQGRRSPLARATTLHPLGENDRHRLDESLRYTAHPEPPPIEVVVPHLHNGRPRQVIVRVHVGDQQPIDIAEREIKGRSRPPPMSDDSS
jgi:hypothetical protein